MLRALLCLALTIQAQSSAPARPAIEELATIRGRVTDAHTGKPLRMTRVVLAPRVQLAYEERTTRTDAGGLYEIRNVPAGAYTLTFSKARYVTTPFNRSGDPSSPPTPIELGPGARLTGMDLALARAGAIAGRVTDELGDPLERASVSAMRLGYTEHGPALVSVATTTTNDAGEYRLWQLQPGEYYVVAAERGGGFGSEADADIGLLRTAWPGATDHTKAKLVRVDAGQTVTGIDIGLAPGTPARLSGRVFTSDSQPAARVVLMLQPVTTGLGGLTGETQSGADGSFVFPAVVSGEYELHARLNQRPAEGAIIPLTVAGADLPGMTIQLSRGGRLRGRVVPPDGTSAAPSAVTVTAAPISRTTTFGTGFGGPIRDDWTFDWDFLLGPRLLRPRQVPAGWWLKSITRDGQDITDAPISFDGAETVEGIEITFDTRRPLVTGSAVTSDGRPADDYSVVAFAEDASRWRPFSRHVATARADHEGRFRIEGLPPGAYRVAAVRTLLPFQWRDSAFLESLREMATEVTLESARPATIVLRLVQQ